VYGVADTRRLVQAVGLSAAKDILFTGRIFDAAQAQGLRLIDRVCDDLDAAAAAFEAALCTASRHTATTTKSILRLIREGQTEDTPASRALFAAAFEGEDFKEGFRAFLEKRPPRFT
jgi:enoyl-CoA hydratase/carnithine racemase